MLAPNRLVSLLDMLNAELHHLIDDQSVVSAFAQAVSKYQSFGFANKAQVDDLSGRLERYVNGLRSFGLEVAAVHAEHVKALVDGAKFRDSDKNYVIEGAELRGVRRYLEYLHNGGLAIEAQLRKFIIIDPQKAELLDDAFSFFGSVVDAQFPGLISESKEASKCFALSRWTASAFHFLRCLEAGIRAVSRCLSIPDPTTGAGRNWSSVSRTMKTAMDEKWPTSANKLSSDYLFFDQIHAAVAAMQNPYRNETMHLSTDYNEDEARHLSEMIRGLMQRIAARCDENGQPLA